MTTPAPIEAIAPVVTAADALASALPGTPVGDVARVTGIVLHGVEGVLVSLFGPELDDARKHAQAPEQAAGASASFNSKLPGLRATIAGILTARTGLTPPNDMLDMLMHAIGVHLGPKQ